MAKEWARRRGKDRTQLLRRGFQAVFLLLNVWIGFEFWRFVEAPGKWARPAGVEGWLPIAGMMNFKYWLKTGEIPAVHPAAMFLFVTFLLISFLARKGFCGWLCPIGTISEFLWRTGRDTFGRNVHLPKWVDAPLRSLKYALAGFFVYAVWRMTAGEIHSFLASPYGLIADVRMLYFFRDLTVTGAATIGALMIASIFVPNLWCRYLCPYGALMGIAAMLGPMRIRRKAEACIDCGKCAKACPARLPVNELAQIRSAECIGCLSCVAECPAEGALDMTLGSRLGRTAPWAMAVAIAGVFLGITALAVWSGHWEGSIPQAAYERLIPLARETGHP